MKKVLSVLLVCTLALTLPIALAVSREDAQTTAQQLVGTQAALVESENDDGIFEFRFRDDAAVYEVDILASDGSVIEIDTRFAGAGRASEFILTAEEALARLPEAYADATVGPALAERDDEDGALFEVFFTAPDQVGAVSLNAETGAVVRTEVYPAAAAQGVIDTAAVEGIVKGRESAAEIVELELSWDNGRYEYDGEARANGREYSFEINAVSGDVLEWEVDD